MPRHVLHIGDGFRVVATDDHGRPEEGDWCLHYEVTDRPNGPGTVQMVIAYGNSLTQMQDAYYRSRSALREGAQA